MGPGWARPWVGRPVAITDRDSIAKEFAIVKSGLHLHMRTCQMRTVPPNSSKFPQKSSQPMGQPYSNLIVHRDPSAKRFALVKSGICPHVRTCHVHNSPQKSPCYLSTTTWPIVLKFSTHIESTSRGIWTSQKGMHPHVPRAQLPPKSHCYILTTTGPIVPTFLETKHLIRFLRALSFHRPKGV